MPFDFTKVNRSAGLFGLPKSGTISAYDARIDYGPDHIHITITGDHGSPDLARQLIDEVTDDGHINSTDRGIARRMIRDWDCYREPDECWTVTGTHINVGRAKQHAVPA